METPADIGLIGLAVMGENLVLNMESKGFTVAVFNRTVSKVDNFVNGRGNGKNIIPCKRLEDLVATLKRPRRVMLMVKAGKAVDAVIDSLIPLLDPGDIIIDGGNSLFVDSQRRTAALAEQGFLFVGTGVSGGEEGALRGPSIMPGGNAEAWPHVKPIFQAIAAKVDDGSPCCEWVGPDGAGHFVKMVHNGIEYSDMQLICEAYDFMSRGLGMDQAAIHDVFDEWNKGELNSYLIEITRDIMAEQDPDTGKTVLDVILDAAGQKGTGKWTAEAGLDLGIAIPQIAEAVFARCISAAKEERVAASKVLQGPSNTFEGDAKEYIEKLHDAVYAAKICSYAQGYQLLRAAAEEYNWELNYGEIALMWREGCIIRAQFLGRIKEAFERDPQLANLLLDSHFESIIENAQAGWRNILTAAISLGIPMPAIGSALSYFDSYRSERLPANLLQAQRDYFGAHTYERVDRPRGEFFHTDWSGLGGSTSSSYNV